MIEKWVLCYTDESGNKCYGLYETPEEVGDKLIALSQAFGVGVESLSPVPLIFGPSIIPGRALYISVADLPCYCSNEWLKKESSW